MKVGIGLPAAVSGVTGPRIREWAVKSDEGPFSSLGTVDRLVYPNYDPLITLATAAGVTQRIQLITNVLLAPLRNAGILAKEAATLDVLSGGRLSLGVAVGSRSSDYHASPAAFETRGRRFEEQLQIMQRVWSGQPVGEGGGQIGPLPVQPGGPDLLIGGSVPVNFQRAAKWGAGYIGGYLTPQRTVEVLRMLEQAWVEEGRPGKPRLVAQTIFALGPKGAEAAKAYIHEFYAYSPAMLELMTRIVLLSPGAIGDLIRGVSDSGLDELILMPCSADLDQIDRLADIVA